MDFFKNFKRNLYKFIKLIIYRIPNILQLYSPLKVYEFKEILKDFKFSKKEVILDIGCGDGLQTIILGKKVKTIYGIDIDKELVLKAKIRSYLLKNKINSYFINKSIEEANFESEYFDKVISICVLEHIKNYTKVLKESYKILKENGYLIFSVDAFENFEDKNLIDIHRKIYRVENYFSKGQLEAVLSTIGFRNLKIYSIFKSNFAKKLFIKGIKYGFDTNYLMLLIRYLLLKYKESRSLNKSKGIFIIVKCQK